MGLVFVLISEYDTSIQEQKIYNETVEQLFFSVSALTQRRYQRLLSDNMLN